MKTLDKLKDVSNENLKIGTMVHWIKQAEHLLQRIEFSGTEMSYSGYPGNLQMKFNACPICGQEGSHDENCELHKLLKEAQEMHI